MNTRDSTRQVRGLIWPRKPLNKSGLPSCASASIKKPLIYRRPLSARARIFASCACLLGSAILNAMECLNPVHVGWLRDRRPDGVYNVVRLKDGPRYFLSETDPSALFVPCGKCVLCNKRKKRDMTVRLVHESLCHKHNCFLTLTYAPAYLPMILDEPVLVKRHLQLFFKRLRNHIGRFRYFGVGEYGTKGGRPHYHTIIYGWQPSDLVEYRWRGAYMVYRSPLVECCWPFGFSTVGLVNVGVARYCAQYVNKKQFSPSGLEPEFWLASKQDGGLGAAFCDRYWQDMIGSNCVFVRLGNGLIVRQPVPRYYLARIRKFHLRDYLAWMDLRLLHVSSPRAYADLSASAEAYFVKQTRKNKERSYDNENNDV